MKRSKRYEKRRKQLSEKVLDEKLLCESLRQFHRIHLEYAPKFKSVPYFEEEFSKTEERIARLSALHQKRYVNLVKKMNRKLK